MTQLTLGKHQEAFAVHAALLIQKAGELGMSVRIGEVLRTEEQQEIYVRTGKSRTRDSMHLKKCAIDLNLFIGERFATRDEIAALGKWWESLDVRNRWGGSWRGKIERGESTFVDAPHFERLVP